MLTDFHIILSLANSAVNLKCTIDHNLNTAWNIVRFRTNWKLQGGYDKNMGLAFYWATLYTNAFTVGSISNH